jgi:hypothetical protein
MANRDDDLLVREIAKLGERGGALGGSLSGSLAGKAGALGGRIGAGFAAKYLPTESYSEKLVLKIAPETVLKLGFSLLTKLGELQAADSENSPYPTLKAIIGSGFLNMNPAIVYIEILAGDATSCELVITAAAKEGLIKQRTAFKAVQRLISGLRERGNTP